MILLDFFIFGTYHFILYMGKNKEDAKYSAVLWAVAILGIGISSLWEAYVIYYKASTDLDFIRKEGLHAFYWSCPTLIGISLLRYYLFSKRKLESMEAKYQSASLLKRQTLKWLLILVYLLTVIFPFCFQRYIDNRF